MSKEITLNLDDQAALIAVVGFISNINIPEGAAQKISEINLGGGNGVGPKEIISGIQSMGSTFGDNKPARNQLLAELSGEKVAVIDSLSLVDYVELLASFFQADAIKQVLELVNL